MTSSHCFMISGVSYWGNESIKEKLGAEKFQLMMENNVKLCPRNLNDLALSKSASKRSRSTTLIPCADVPGTTFHHAGFQKCLNPFQVIKLWRCLVFVSSSNAAQLTWRLLSDDGTMNKKVKNFVQLVRRNWHETDHKGNSLEGQTPPWMLRH